MSSIDPTLLLSEYQKQSQVKTGGDTLGKDAFLKLLMTQLQNQDPTKPMDDTQFISQMATFSTLEQMTNISTGIASLLQLEQQNTLVGYSNFIGKEVMWHTVTEGNETTEPVIDEGTGIIKSIEFSGDKVYFVLDSGKVLEPGNVSKINHTDSGSTGSGNNLVAASELIGKLVSWLNDSKEEVSAVVKSVSIKDGKTLYELNDADGTKISSNQLISISNI